MLRRDGPLLRVPLQPTARATQVRLEQLRQTRLDSGPQLGADDPQLGARRLEPLVLGQSDLHALPAPDLEPLLAVDHNAVVDAVVQQIADGRRAPLAVAWVLLVQPVGDLRDPEPARAPLEDLAHDLS